MRACVRVGVRVGGLACVGVLVGGLLTRALACFFAGSVGTELGVVLAIPYPRGLVVSTARRHASFRVTRRLTPVVKEHHLA